MSKEADNSDQNPVKNLTDQIVLNYLKSHPECIEKCVMEDVELDLLERWVIRRTQKTRKFDSLSATRRTSLSRWKFCVHADKREMLEELTASLQEEPSETNLVEEFSKCVSTAVNADRYHLFLIGPDGLKLHGGDKKEDSGDKSEDIITAQVVSNTRQPLRIRARGSLIHPDAEVGEERVCHSLFQPLTRSDGELIGVIQLCRNATGTPFYEEDEEIVSSYLVWGGVAFHYSQLYTSVKIQRELNEFLLQVVRSIFQEIVNTDMLVRKIIDFAQHLVEADRASLFLLDPGTNELRAKLFDYGRRNRNGGAAEDEVLTGRPISFPRGVGIAGYVAETKKLVNIEDAYKDPRFNREVDKKTGYKTKSILCMPILKSSGDIIGVVQMVNKKTGNFTKEDEKNFEMFAVYCALALNHADMFEKIKQSEQKYKIAVEVLSYHSTCTEEEVNQVLPATLEYENLDRFDLNFMDTNDVEKAKIAVFMFNDLFGAYQFDNTCIVRFTLTVCKNYRRVPYHNWTHGFSVANTMYAILKKSPGVFELQESLALFIGALCHDLDHRGKDNKFMIESASPLAYMYSTSTLENHHFNQTVTILQQEGHNIFKKLTRDEYKIMLEIIRHCILATDLALFVKHHSMLSSAVNTGEFSMEDTYQKSLVMAMAMTASDLSASAKPWDIQIETVRVIFEEFYLQGDEEKRAGREPIPMMDRNQPENQAISQVEFLTEICIPCYSVLAKVVPGSEPLLIQCEKNLKRWIEICEENTGDFLGVAKPKTD